MRSKLWRLVVLAALGALAVAPTPAQAATAPVSDSGSIGGAPYQIDVPGSWNGTLVLWSHGYEVPPGIPRPPASDAPDDAITKPWLLSHGYALAGSSYSQAGWAVQQALHDQIALLDYFAQKYGKPKRTIAWGASLGGMITAGLVQVDPRRFSGAAPLCGVLAGGVGVWNEGLDGGFVLKTLTGPNSPLQLVHITDPAANLAAAESLINAAQQTAQGRARIALAAAVGDVPGWFAPGSPEPARTDFTSREQNQYDWLSSPPGPDFAFSFSLRAELEQRAGGNPSWNTGVDYRRQLDRSIDRDEVVALYRHAGLDLNQDLRALDSAPRIAADPKAVDYLKKYIIFNGNIRVPVLTMHTIGDGLVLPEDEQAYASVVRAAGNQRLLRQTFVHAAGHCNFTPAETIATFETLVRRLDTGSWGDSTTPADMNATATATGLPGGSSFVGHRPGVFLRPFDARQRDDGGGDQKAAA